ncbi:hypothetical protein BV898_03177 [Hypsibius exemplaris]|uniref:Uncharacterized protein n=1 Tax=Hypsibius exemplaris TaxID=2072580 RepID=A0A1W0X5Q9_HYPEX|nr:hypothetical protein BV898_03177 [Hypsibius exemplaris]
MFALRPSKKAKITDEDAPNDTQSVSGVDSINDYLQSDLSKPEEQSPLQTAVEAVESCFKLVSSATKGSHKIYRCKICFKNQEVARQQSYRAKTDAYCKESGGEKPYTSRENYVSSDKHLICVQQD